MNQQPVDGHPTEEQLAEQALGGGSEEVAKHLDRCPDCARTVKEFREVKRQVTSFDEEEVPIRTEQRIRRITRHGQSTGLLAGLQALFANPFLIALVVAIVVIMLYFLVGSEVFKGP